MYFFLNHIIILYIYERMNVSAHKIVNDLRIFYLPKIDRSYLLQRIYTCICIACDQIQYELFFLRFNTLELSTYKVLCKNSTNILCSFTHIQKHLQMLELSLGLKCIQSGLEIYEALNSVLKFIRKSFYHKPCCCIMMHIQAVLYLSMYINVPEANQVVFVKFFSFA